MKPLLWSIRKLIYNFRRRNSNKVKKYIDSTKTDNLTFRKQWVFREKRFEKGSDLFNSPVGLKRFDREISHFKSPRNTARRTALKSNKYPKKDDFYSNS